MTTGPVMSEFDCFISYSHSADDDIAPALSSALQRFNKPWHRRRALRVFRDRAQLAPSHRLWSTILDALDRSRFFVLLASPGAARSEGVQREVERWLHRHGTEGLLIVLTEGELRWREEPSGFAEEESCPLPPSLRTAFAEEPLHLDLRWALGREGLSLRDPRFLDGVAELAAAIHGRPKEDLIGEDQAQHRRTRRTVRAAVAALAVLTTTSVAAAVVAVAQRNAADAQRRVALSRQLAAQATTMLARSPERQSVALLLAMEASRLEPSGEAAQALRAALGLSPPLLATLEPEERYGPGDGVQWLAFRPDGRRLAVARDHGGADVFDPAGGERVVGLSPVPRGRVTVQEDGTGYNESITELAFSPDGTLLATAGNDSVARVWRVGDGEQLHRMRHAGRVRTLAFDPAGIHLATGDDAGVVHLWRVDSGGERVTHLRENQAVDEVAFSPDGRRLAALWEWGGVAVIRVESASVEHESDAGAYSFGGVTFSPDGSLLATGHDGFAAVWDAGTGRELRRVLHTDFADDLHYNSPTGLYDVAFGPDGRFLATASRDGTARVWSLETGQEVVRLSHAPYAVDQVFFDGDGSTLITESYRAVRAWEVPSGRELWRAVHDDEVWAVAPAPDGRSIAVGDAGGAVRIWGLRGGDRLAVLDHPDDVIAVAVHPGGRFFATLDDRDDVRVWDRGGALLTEATDREGWFNLRGMAMSRDGGTLALAGQAPSLTTLDVGNGLEGTYAAGYPEVDEGYVSPRFVAVVWTGRGTSTVDSVRVWDPSAPRGGDLVLEIAGGSGIRFDPSGSYLAARGADRTFHVWDLPGRREVASFDVLGRRRDATRREAGAASPASGAESRVSAFSLAPGGRLFALAVREPGEAPFESVTFLDVRDVASGAQADRVRHPGDVRRMEFGGDGRILITATDDVVYVWRTDDLEAEPVVLAHGDEVRSSTLFGPGFRVDSTGRFVATLSGGRVRVWSSADGSLLSEMGDAGRILDFAFTPDGRQILTGSSSDQAVLWSWQSADLAAEGCRHLTRNLTHEEWGRYMGRLPYRESCPGMGGPDPSSAGTEG